MKICKKCKKHVPNKAKICKYCGTDVSKCKIIKNTPSPKKNPSSKNLNKVPNPKNISKQKPLEIEIKASNNKTSKQNNEKKSSKKILFKKSLPNKKPKHKEKITKTSKLFSFLKSKLKNLKIKLKNVFKKKPKKRKPKTSKKDHELKSKLKKIVNFFSIIRNFFLKIFRKLKSSLAKAFNFLKKLINKLFKKIPFKKEWFINHKKILKRVCLTIVIFVLVLGLGILSVLGYKHFTNAENTIVVGEKATTDKLFSMGDLITYNGVNYKVLSVKTSQGNNYKAPKEGNEFLIVMVYIENTTGHKIQYSYKNWTMSNSKEEEETRIFTSINVDTALYSGDLVIGGIKKGSMVFEQPKNDDKLRLNFYDLKKDEEGNEVIDKDKKIFSVSIKVPEETSKTKTKKTVTTAKELDEKN